MCPQVQAARGEPSPHAQAGDQGLDPAHAGLQVEDERRTIGTSRTAPRAQLQGQLARPHPQGWRGADVLGLARPMLHDQRQGSAEPALPEAREEGVRTTSVPGVAVLEGRRDQGGQAGDVPRAAATRAP